MYTSKLNSKNNKITHALTHTFGRAFIPSRSFTCETELNLSYVNVIMTEIWTENELSKSY